LVIADFRYFYANGYTTQGNIEFVKVPFSKLGFYLTGC
jgi:hypothetical protein